MSKWFGGNGQRCFELGAERVDFGLKGGAQCIPKTPFLAGFARYFGAKRRRERRLQSPDVRG